MPEVLNVRTEATGTVHSRPRAQFFSIRTDPKPVNNIFISFPSCKGKEAPRKNLLNQDTIRALIVYEMYAENSFLQSTISISLKKLNGTN